MAEVLLGTVASIAGITSLAVQAADGLIKLRKFCADVKDAPKELKQMLDYLDILSVHLEDMMTLFNSSNSDQTPASTTASYRGALNLCAQAAAEVHSIVMQLEKAVQRKRTKGSVKAVLKQADLKTLNRRLERAISLLNLCYTASSLKSIMQVGQLVTSQKHTSTMVPPSPTCNSRDLSLSTVGNSTLQGGQECGVQVSHDPAAVTLRYRYPHEKSSRRIRFKLPFFFANKLMELTYSYSTVGWMTDLGFTTYNVVPYDSAIVVLSKQKDIEGVMALFETGQASPYDITEDGCTALSYSLRYLKFTAVKHRFWKTFNFNINIDQLSLFEYGLDKALYGLLEDMINSTDPDIDSDHWVQRWNAWVLPAALVKKVSSHHGLYARPLSERIAHAFHVMASNPSWVYSYIHVFEARAGCEVGDTESMNAFYDLGLLGPLVRLCSMAHWRGEEGAMSKLQRLICWLAEDGTDLTGYFERTVYPVDQDWPCSLLQNLLQGRLLCEMPTYSPFHGIQEPCALHIDTVVAILKESMYDWLNWLHDAGVDLEAYGRAERDNLRFTSKQLNGTDGISFWHVCEIGFFIIGGSCKCFKSCRVMELVYGPRPDDWNILFSWRLDEFMLWEGVAYTFWKQIEAPLESRMPGGWDN